MKHFDKNQLENYAARQLSADEMTRVILHLEDCAECFETLEQINFAEKNENIRLFSEFETENFHLDYDEHLEPFVDNKADAATREIVESHTQMCAVCAFQLRELREFADSLRLRELEKKSSENKFNKFLKQFVNLPHFLTSKFVFSSLLILIIGIAAIVWFATSKNQNSTETVFRSNAIKEKQTTKDITNSEETIVKNPAELETNAETNKKEIQTISKAEDSSIAKKDESEEKYLAELEELPADLRQKVRKTLETEQLTFPVFLGILTQKINLRGENSNDSPLISPNKTVVRDNSPKLSWKPFGAKDETYTVEIFDENNDSIEMKTALRETVWKLKTPLKRGKIYSWEVSSEAQKKTFSGKFAVAENAEIKAKSSLVRGIIFASNGLLNEAESELKKAIQTGEKPELARKLLNQIQKNK